MSLKHLAVLAIILGATAALPASDEKQGKIGIFNVVRFPNDVCKGSGSLNGTCYTKEECSNRKGTASGECANGFGVCCVISLTCGGSSSDNCTNLVQAATTSPTTDCQYKICPVSSSVNRIRLDLSTFVIAGPGAVTAATITTVDAWGQCLTDTFSVTSSGKAAPVICGTNSGQHMIVDSNGMDCITATFNFGGGTTSRSYSIHVIQFEMSNKMGGPPGCLQYFTGTTGTISSFNWVSTASVHLANQDYDVCIRRPKDKCAICYSETAKFVTKTTKGTFGVGISGAAITTVTLTGTHCANDYVVIPNGVSKTSTTATTFATTATVSTHGPSRRCGRLLETASTSVCSNVVPFRMGVKFDSIEVATTAGATGKANVNEGSAGATNDPLGTMGFSLGYALHSC